MEGVPQGDVTLDQRPAEERQAGEDERQDVGVLIGQRVPAHEGAHREQREPDDQRRPGDDGSEAAQAIGRLGRRGCLRGLLDAVDGCAHGPPAYATPSAPVPARRPFARDEAVEPPRVAQSRW